MSMRTLPTNRRIAGVVLAGGRSSRMGRNKALLPYRGRLLIDHIVYTLRLAGLTDVYISGSVPGYDGIPDDVTHDGPAKAMGGMLRRFARRYDALLFMPVDMPKMTPEMLAVLCAQPGNASFECFPLPALLSTGENAPECEAVRALLERVSAYAVPLPAEGRAAMRNVNTRDEWEEAIAS